MVRGESKWEAVLSWADEVEKEEVAAAAAAAQQKHKSDPFATARPREVVLQGKGIDWRKLDANLEQPSRIRHESKNERLNKGSSSPLGTKRLTRTQQNTPGRELRKKLQDIEQGFGRVPVSPIVLVPSVRYPPKFVGGRLYDDWVSTLTLTRKGQQSKSLNESDFGHPNIESLNPEKENSFPGNQPEGRKFHNAGIESVERRNGRMKSELFQAWKAQHKDRKLQKSASQANQVNADSVLMREKFHGRNMVELPLKSEDKRRQSANKRDVRNRRDDDAENTM